MPKLLNIERASFKFAGEEHGEVIYDNGACPLNIGDKISLIPTHCDTTVNLYDHFIIYSGEFVTDVWKIGAREDPVKSFNYPIPELNFVSLISHLTTAQAT